MADETQNRDATPRPEGAEASPAEPVATAEPAPVAETPGVSADPQPTLQPAPAGRQPGAGSMIVGGALAAAIGAAATLVFLPEGWRQGDAGLEPRLAAVESRPEGLDAAALRLALEPLETRLAAIEGTDPSAGLDQRIAALEARSLPDLTPVEARITALETAPRPDSGEIDAALAPLLARIARIEADIAAQARAAVDAALAEARAAVDAQAQAVAAREDSVEAAQARIAARAALAELVAAAESGAAVPAALATLDTANPALAPFETGLVTLAALQDAFPETARAALAADAPGTEAPLADRMLGFLRAQTGARSLAPRDGDDTDATLSRAEAALRAGDLGAVLSELDGLAPDPAAAIAEWRALAETRLVAMQALAELRDRIAGNGG